MRVHERAVIEQIPMDCKLLVKEDENSSSPLVVFNEQCVVATKTTLSYAINSSNQYITYANKEVRDTNNNLIATISRVKHIFTSCAEVFAATSPFLSTPGTIVNVSDCGNMIQTWTLASGTVLKISGKYFSSKATITALDANHTEVEIAALVDGDKVIIEPGVDAAAVIVLCRTWNHAQNYMMIDFCLIMFFTGAVSCVTFVGHVLQILLTICIFLGLALLVVRPFRG